MMIGVGADKLKDEIIAYKNKVLEDINEFFRPTEEKENIFVFDNNDLLEVARRYLGKYERSEASKIMRGQKQLVFTNQIGRSFTRAYERADPTLEQLSEFLEEKFDKPLSQIDKAFLEWEFYNESEQRIIELVIKGTFKIELNKVEKYLFNRGLNKYFERGDEVFASDIEEIFGKLNERRLTLYKFVS